ncbi:MAG: branched chain amino acid aminotransferase [Planctomycetota bacterium]|nr:MAG: branched chain amino acid aminotransferase [Planctomycetota bacterium]
MSEQWALFDGQVVPAAEARVSAFDRTLLYGLGAFETVRLFEGRAFLLDRHVERLHASLGAVGLAVPPFVNDLAQQLADLAERAQQPNALCRITVTAGDAGAGVNDMHVIAQLRAAPEPRGSRRMEVGLVDFAHDLRSPLAGVKSTNYLIHYMLREAAEAAGRLDDLMVEPEGGITEATVANVFFVFDGELVTPALEGSILPGVTRAHVLELAQRLELPVRERRVHRDELPTASEAFLTGSGKGLVDLDVLAGRTLPTERPHSLALADALARSVEQHCALPAGSVRF